MYKIKHPFLILVCTVLVISISVSTYISYKTHAGGSLSSIILKDYIDTNPIQNHNYSDSLQYKSPYMVNAPNFINLYNSLPNDNLELNYSLRSDTLTANINYFADYSTLDQDIWDNILMYNSVVCFSTIDNLNNIHYEFNDITIRVSRVQVENMFEDFTKLEDVDYFNENVKDKINDLAFSKVSITTNTNTDPKH